MEMYCTQEDKLKSLEDKENILHAEAPTLLRKKNFEQAVRKILRFYRSELTASRSGEHTC